MLRLLTNFSYIGNMIKWLQILIGALWFPHSILRILRLGYDWNIYYNYSKYGTKWGWLYADWVKYIFTPFTLLPFGYSFLAWYCVLILCWIYIVQKAKPYSWLVFIVTIYPMLLCLELGQVTPLLAVLAFSPLGAVLFTFIKPYGIIFVGIHIYLAWRNAKHDVSESQPIAPDTDTRIIKA